MRYLALLLVYSFSISANNNGLSFERSWIRAVPSVSRVSAGFGLVKNSTNRDRKLVRIESNISEVVELHTHKENAGIMKMRPVEFIKVNKESEVELKRLSYHIMFINLTKVLKVGQKIPIKLIFDNGDYISQSVEVKKM